MDFSEVIKNRYSCKKFSDVEVKKEKLDKILEAGRVAPTAKNLQEQHMVHIIIHNRIYKIYYHILWHKIGTCLMIFFRHNKIL